jgi:hypothetical protein
MQRHGAFLDERRAVMIELALIVAIALMSAAVLAMLVTPKTDPLLRRPVTARVASAAELPRALNCMAALRVTKPTRRVRSATFTTYPRYLLIVLDNGEEYTVGPLEHCPQGVQLHRAEVGGETWTVLGIHE